MIEWMLLGLFILGAIPFLFILIAIWPFALVTAGYCFGGFIGFFISLGAVLLILGLKEELA